MRIILWIWQNQLYASSISLREFERFESLRKHRIWPYRHWAKLNMRVILTNNYFTSILWARFPLWTPRIVWDERFVGNLVPFFLLSKPPYTQRRVVRTLHESICRIYISIDLFIYTLSYIKQSKSTFSLILLSLNEFVFICATVYHCQLSFKLYRYIWHRTHHRWLLVVSSILSPRCLHCSACPINSIALLSH